MAGGQERILRGRIRTMQATKKITRAMELIAASRIVKAQQRVQAAVPYSEQITEVVKDLAAGGCQQRLAAARRPRRDQDHLLRRDHRRPRPVRRLQRRRAARRRGRDQGRRAGGQGATRSSRSAARPRSTSGSAATRSARASPASATTRPTTTPRRSASTSSSCTPAARSTGSSWSTPASSRPAARRSCCARWCRSAPTSSRVATARPEPTDGAGGDYEFEPDPGDDPRDAAAALRRGPRLRRPAQRRRLRARLPPAGDEVGHRQRRRADQEPQHHDEPSPPGLDHHRDHGDRQRRRGARLRQAADVRHDLESAIIDLELNPRSDRRPTAMTMTDTPTRTGRPRVVAHRRPGDRRRVPRRTPCPS